MAPEFEPVHLVIISVASAIGIPANAFISIFNFLDLAKGQRMNTCDHIIMSLGLSNACCHGALLGYVFNAMKLKLDHHFMHQILNHILLWTGGSCCWLTACLCVFYCVKIVDFNHRLFIRLKMRISKVVPWLLLGSLVGPLVLGSCAYWNPVRSVSQNSTNLTYINPFEGRGLAQSCILMSDTLGFLLPISLGIPSIVLILASLYRHIRRMKANASGFSQPRLGAHVEAARVVGCLLLIYVCILSVQCARICLPSAQFATISWVVVVCFTAAQPFVLIMGNIKLKLVLCKVLSPWRYRGT